jgi:hypothetical protein
MERGDFEHACPKLAASYTLDPALGTLLNLALCHERVGRVATARREYRDAIAAATAAGDDERLRFATERARAVEMRVPHLTIHVVAPVDGLVVTRDGVIVPASELGVRIDVDPGDIDIGARAARKRAWTGRANVREGADVTVSIPELVDEPVVVAPTRKDYRAAIATGGVGVASVVAGSVLGLVARSRWSQARQHCSETTSGLACDSTGLALSRRASDYAIASTITIGVGIVGIGGAIVLAKLRPARKHDAMIAPTPRRGGAVVMVVGSF